MRPILTILCILLTLACPHICGLKRAAAASSDLKSQACCEKCRQKAAAEHDSPVDPAQDRNGRGCFCDGVAFDVGGRVSLDEMPLIAWIDFIDISLLRLDIAVRPSFETLPQPPPIAGKAARIQISSLLL